MKFPSNKTIISTSRRNHLNNYLYKCSAIIFLSHVLTLLLVNTVNADENHYNNILIGDRASGLGGAYVSIADDTSGLYYNPAGLVHAVGSNISGSMNAYHNTTTTYKKALGGQFDWVRESSILAPNFFGIFQPLGTGKIGFSYAVTDSIFEDQDQEFNNIDSNISSYIINFNNQDATYQFGPSYAAELNDELSFGITLYAHVRTQQIINNQIITLSAVPDYEWNNTYEYNEESGFHTIFGLMWTPIEKVSLGATLRKTYIYDSKHIIESTCKGISDVTSPLQGSCFGEDPQRSISNTSAKRDHPLQLTAGLTYFYNQRLLITSDLNYFSSTSASFEDARTSVINFSVGGEYYLDNEWAIRSGFYTNFANTPDLKTTNVTSTQATHVDLYGLSFSLSHFSRNSVLSFGFNTMYGTGKAQLAPASNGNALLQDVEMATLTLFLSATYSY